MHSIQCHVDTLNVSTLSTNTSHMACLCTACISTAQSEVPPYSAAFQVNRRENKTDGLVGKLSGRTGSNGKVLHDVVYRLSQFFLTVCQQIHQFCFLFCLLGKLHCIVAPHSVLLQLNSDSQSFMCM